MWTDLFTCINWMFGLRDIFVYIVKQTLMCCLSVPATPIYDLAKLVAHNIQNDLMEAASSPSGGIYVYWGIKSSGKTAYATALVQRLNQTPGRRALYLNYESISTRFFRSVVLYICRFCLSRQGNDFHTNPLSPTPTTIIIDDFDHYYDNNADANVQRNSGLCLQKFIRELAKESCMKKAFSVILFVSSAQRAADILQWDWEHIRLVSAPGSARWQRNHVESLFHMYAYLLQKNESDRGATMAMCVQAATPGFIAYLARPGYLHDSNAQARATDNQRLWEEGEALLNVVSV
jgi:hypothetical protein